MHRLTVGAIALTLISLTALATAAAAHERRQVGPYTLVVGFLIEPVFAGEVNGVDLRVTETSSSRPVEGLQDTLQVEVTAQGQSRTFKLRSRFGQPGAYAADFVPTRTGTYVFRFFGRIGDREVNERFESGPGRFNEPEETADFRFPSVGDSEARGAVDEVRGAVEQTRLLALAALVVAIVLPLALRSWPRR